jgi:hypothetical protein
LQLFSLYLAKVIAISDFFQDFLRTFIQENYKILNIEYEAYAELQYTQNALLSRLHLAKLMVIPYFEI